MSLLDLPVRRRHGEQRDTHRLVSRLSAAMLNEVHLERRAGGWLERRPLAAGEPGRAVGSEIPVADGSATDVIGWIESLNPTSVRLVTTVPAARVIERSMIIAARRAPPAAGGPHPRRISAHDVQRHALRELVGVARAAG